jgi:hypothetical protein
MEEQAVTSMLERAGQGISDARTTSAVPLPEPQQRGSPRGSWFARYPAWPITAMLAGMPAWWALGIGDYIPIALAIPIAREMYRWRANRLRPIRVPPGFGLWVMFLIVTLAGLATINLIAPETVASPLHHKIFSFVIRLAQYISITIMFLYAGNLTEEELPRRRLAWLLGLVAIYATIGGVGGVVAPNFRITSPLAFVIPSSLIASSSLFQGITHPGLAEVQTILGAPAGRPDAPFTFTNTWGSAVVMLVPWLLVGWWWRGSRRERWIAAAAIVVVMVPFLYSLDRGAWLAAGVAVLYIALRMAARGRIALLGAIITIVAMAAIAIAVTPLHNLVVGRVHNGKSDAIRLSQASIALKDAEASPIIGYGDTRHMQGSPQSITIGPSGYCPTCGQYEIGSNGQLWLLLICSGFLGAALYLGFFGYGIWHYRKDLSPYGLAGVLVLLLTFVFMFAYDAVGSPLVFTMLSYALLWRNEMAARQLSVGQPSVTGAARSAQPSGLPREAPEGSLA